MKFLYGRARSWFAFAVLASLFPSSWAVGGSQSYASEWKENRLILQALLDSGDVSALRLRSTRESSAAHLVVPFVPSGTAFRLNEKPWKSVPWLTRGQRLKGNYLEVYSLLKRKSLVHDVPAADVRAFFPSWNHHVDARLLFTRGKWRVDSIRVTIE